MAQLSIDERRDLIREFTSKEIINWGYIALAQLTKDGFVDQILTTNFDSLILRASALLGDFPAVYDLTVAKEFDHNKAVEKSVLFLHGQQHGFITLNTEAEFSEFDKNLKSVFYDAANRIWIIVGYSGLSDPVFEHLAEVKQFENSLYWVGYFDEKPAAHILEKILVPGKDTVWVKGFDFDSFFVTLARNLLIFEKSKSIN